MLKCTEETRTDDRPQKVSPILTGRFEGGAPWYDSMAQKMPREKGKEIVVDDYLDLTEVQTRMSFVLHQFRILDLHSLDWDASFEQLGLDSLETTAILTSIEHEFHTVFEDRVFENFTSLGEVQRFIATDHNCF